MSGIINPSSLPFRLLHLRSTSIAQADSSALSLWPDISGNGRDALQVDPNLQPVYHSTSAGRSPNGKAGVSFDGLDSPLNDTMTGGWTNGGSPIPTDITGFTCYFYARWSLPVNGFNGGVIWQPFSGSRPQLIQKFGGINDGGFQDTDFGNHGFGGAVAIPQGVQTVTYRFTPPKGLGGGDDELWINGISPLGGPSTLDWGWTPQPADQYILSGNSGGNLAVKMDLFECVLFGTAHNEKTRRGVEKFFKAFYGT